MRRPLLPITLLAAVVVVLGFAWLTISVASASDTTRAQPQGLDVAPFSGLRVSGHAEVELIQGNREGVDVEPGPRSQAKLRVRNDKDELVISVEAPESSWGFFRRGSARPLRVIVHFRALDAITINGDVRVTADAIKADALLVRASGSTSVRLDGLDTPSFRFVGSGAVKGDVAGRASAQQVSISGAGSYRAPDLVSERAEVKVSGAGRVVVNATRTLDASISGAGAIDYFGNPKVRERITGAGRIKRLSGGDHLADGLIAFNAR